MSRIGEFMREPRRIGILCAVGAVGLGLIYLFLAGAPARHLAINGAALLAGLAIYATLALPGWRLGRAADAFQLSLALVLLATALLAAPVEGATRWIAVGPLSLQVSLIVLPAMLVGFARMPTVIGAVSMAVAALALALQPDRAMAGVLVAGLAVLAWRQPSRIVAMPLAVAAAGFAIALLRPDALPAVAYVDQVFYTAFSVSPLAGGAVVGGAALLVLPALVAPRIGMTAVPVFGAVWACVILAAALGNYPTPLVGYGGSAIVGYLASLAMLPSVRAEQAARSDQAPASASKTVRGRSLAASLA